MEGYKPYNIVKITNTSGQIQFQQFKIPAMVFHRDSYVQIKSQFLTLTKVNDVSRQYVQRVDAPQCVNKMQVYSDNKQIFQTDFLKFVSLNYTQHMMNQQPFTQKPVQMTGSEQQIANSSIQSSSCQIIDGQQQAQDFLPLVNFQTIFTQEDDDTYLTQKTIISCQNYPIYQFFPFTMNTLKEYQQIPQLDIQMQIDKDHYVFAFYFYFGNTPNPSSNISNVTLSDLQITFYMKQIQEIPQQISTLGRYNEYLLGPQSYNLVLQGLNPGFIILMIQNQADAGYLVFEKITNYISKTQITINGRNVIDGQDQFSTMVSFQMGYSKNKTNYNNQLGVFKNNEKEIQIAGYTDAQDETEFIYLIVGYAEYIK